MTFNDVEFKACPKCGAEPKVEDVRERSLTKPNVLSSGAPPAGCRTASRGEAWTCRRSARR